MSAGPNLDPVEETVFYSTDESTFYATCLRNLVLQHCPHIPIDELGTGDAMALIKALKDNPYDNMISSYEIDHRSSRKANENVEQHGEEGRITIINESFFRSNQLKHRIVVSNPPYLPAERAEQLLLPTLWGGKYGNDVSKSLLQLGYEKVMLLVSSYSDPVSLLEVAREQGYAVSGFITTSLQFGYYSRQDIVLDRIAEMKKNGKAFYCKSHYLVSGVLFDRDRQDTEEDLMQSFGRIMTSI